jgi:quercetin dioxygenase-like cupin family protein
MIRAYKIFTRTDGHTHLETGTVAEGIFSQVQQVRFKETPAPAVYDWHTAPTTQYVLTLSGTLLFEFKSGETFLLEPGDVLIAMDTTGSGHKWEIIGDESWKRVYVLFNPEEEVNFIPNSQ